GTDFTVRLVVHDHAAHRFGGLFTLDDATINADSIVQIDALTEGRVLAIDLDPALADPGFDVATRAYANTCQNLLQLFACGSDFLAVLLVFFTHLGTSRCVDSGDAEDRRDLLPGPWKPADIILIKADGE